MSKFIDYQIYLEKNNKNENNTKKLLLINSTTVGKSQKKLMPEKCSKNCEESENHINYDGFFFLSIKKDADDRFLFLSYFVFL